MRKVFISVTARFEPDGTIIPLFLVWENGEKYEIDKILDIRRAASLKVGGAGLRYTCRIQGKEAYLFYEAPRWFVEAKQ